MKLTIEKLREMKLPVRLKNKDSSHVIFALIIGCSSVFCVDKYSDLILSSSEIESFEIINEETGEIISREVSAE